MLEHILGSRSKVRILRFFFRDIEREYILEEISKGIGMSLGTVHPAMNQLVDARALSVHKAGRSRVYSINRKHILFDKLVRLYETEFNGFLALAEKYSLMSNKKGIKNVILFGSVARNEVTGAGDIDIMVICRKKCRSQVENEGRLLAQRFLDENDTIISVLFISVDEVKTRIKRFDGFILNIINEGYVLYGDPKWLGM